MKIKTNILQEMVAKAIKAVSNNKIIPLTCLMGIELDNNKLTLQTTDGNNVLKVCQPVESLDTQNFYTIVNADTFSKLVSKTTSEYIILENNENYLEFRGNGNYKLEIALNSDGEIVKFPNYEIKDESVKIISAEKLKNTLTTAKVCIAQTMEVPCLTGYYIGDKVLSTNRDMVCYIDEKLIDTPILISSDTALLIQLISKSEIKLIINNNILSFITDDIVINCRELEGKDIYPLIPLENLVKLNYDMFVNVNKNELLNVLDRMSLFVTDYDKNGVYLKFTKDGLEVRSQKSNAIELLDIKSDKPILEFECLADVEMLKSQIQTLASDIVSLYYGQSSSIEIKEGNIIMILSLIERVS